VEKGIKMAYPTEYKYTKEHEWLKVDGTTGTIGITDHAQNSLGDIVFVELPKIGAEITAGQTFGSVESVKAVSDLYAPVSGTVTAINEVVRTAIAAKWKGIMEYETEPIVSSDVTHSSFSSTFDSLATMVLGENVSKTLSWYDAGWGYAHRVVELLERFQALDREASR